MIKNDFFIKNPYSFFINTFLLVSTNLSVQFCRNIFRSHRKRIRYSIMFLRKSWRVMFGLMHILLPANRKINHFKFINYFKIKKPLISTTRGLYLLNNSKSYLSNIIFLMSLKSPAVI